ncbi:hypothetical protein UFOVP131_32 [uncultured Caudovirales phage]|jgi:hypothetical protein|uniref:Uncharacterized protein n=1 Tax=uncultured Caudovirales phage TaxID=2100421 RepID=A0A6J5LBP1_9CAUD|nr:hypothetical protein UFOVP131_32 [uncultured Caudovirales phage]
MWNAPVPIFDDEDEAELINSFVEYSARYPTYPTFEIAQYVFRNQRDPEMRANQAALVWGNSLDIKERIRRAKQNGGVEPEEYTKEKWQAEVLAIARDDELSAVQRKSKIDGLNLYAQGMGWLAKPADAGKDDNRAPQMPTFVFAQYPDQNAA